MRCAGGGGWWHEEPMENVLRHPDPSHDGVLGDGVKVRHGGDRTQLSDQIMQQWFTSDQLRQHSVRSRIISIPHRTRFLALWDENCNPGRRQVELNFIKSYNYSPWERLRLKNVTQARSKMVNILMDCCLYICWSIHYLISREPGQVRATGSHRHERLDPWSVLRTNIAANSEMFRMN